MKKTLIASILSLTSSFSFAGNYFYWSLDDSTTPVEQLTFPMSFIVTPDKSGFYFAYQIRTESSNKVMYTGFQPIAPDSNYPNKHMFKLIFSNFYEDTIDFNSDYCHAGADGGKGVSCKNTYPLELNKKYAMKVTAEKGQESTRYTGTLIDAETGYELATVGGFRVPNDTNGGLFLPAYNGFIEKYNSQGCLQNITAIHHKISGKVGSYEIGGYTHSYSLNPNPCFEIKVNPIGEALDKEIVINPAN